MAAKDTSPVLLSTSDVKYKQHNLLVNNINLTIETVYRTGDGAPIVFLHGFGSTKEDYLDISHHPAFAGRPFLAFDAPGCGQTICEDLSKIGIQFLVDTAKTLLDHLNIRQYHLVGHSMGGLTALQLAHQDPASVLSFVNIKGNLAPEDCFLSRQIVTYPSEDPESFFEDFIVRTRDSRSYSSAIYAVSLRHKVRSGAIYGIFESMVQLSDHGDLLLKFLSLPCPRVYMFGEEYSSLSYLSELASKGVDLAEIPYSGHFPMYSNAVAMWEQIAGFFKRHDL
ncbi:alpha/beta hydrolase fold protein [Bisporella sp. PMI_857]|nr:alpha/beta hydrolase fold protein [Bisporella sp. PMI_857]